MATKLLLNAVNLSQLLAAEGRHVDGAVLANAMEINGFGNDAAAALDAPLQPMRKRMLVPNEFSL